MLSLLASAGPSKDQARMKSKLTLTLPLTAVTPTVVTRVVMLKKLNMAVMMVGMMTRIMNTRVKVNIRTITTWVSITQMRTTQVRMRPKQKIQMMGLNNPRSRIWRTSPARSRWARSRCERARRWARLRCKRARDTRPRPTRTRGMRMRQVRISTEEVLHIGKEWSMGWGGV
jgi:hypothetical protein